MRVAFVSASNGCMLKSEYTESRKSANRPRRHTIALPHSRRLCAAAGSLPPPLLDARKSVPFTARANMHASIGVTGYPRSGKLPAPSRHRSPTLSQAVRGGRLTPAAASRCSKICPIDRPRQHAYKHRCDRIPKVRQTARAVVSSLSGTLADCARPRGRSLDTKDCAIKKCSARLLTDPQERLPAKVEYALRAITWVLACVRLRVRHRSGLPVVHSVSGN